MPKSQPFRIRLAKAILGRKAKEYIPSLIPTDLIDIADGRINNFATKSEQLGANVGWCFTANSAIVEPLSAIPIKLYRKTKGGKREEIFEHEILDLLENPNLAHTGEQIRQLHATYMNFNGESYIMMREGANVFEPRLGKVPDALDIFPSHLTQFRLGTNYTSSTVSYAGQVYPVTTFIRDLNPDPQNPYFGRSVISAAAVAIDGENQMKRWNQGVFARGGHPSMIIRSKDGMSDEVYDRFRKQIDDEVAGTENAHRPLIVEGADDVSPYMMNAKDLDFLQSRKFSRDEILAMWKVSPGILGMVENVNRANLNGAFFLNAVINLEPRIRQWVRQLNVTLTKPFDPLMELDYVSPVPEDVEAKIAYATKANGGWLTIDEVRALFNEAPLPDDLGKQIYQSANNASLTSIADGSARPARTPGATEPVDNSAKSFALPGGVKKKT